MSTIKLYSAIPSPSLAGKTVIVYQAVLLAPGHRSPAPSQGTDSSVTYQKYRYILYSHAGSLAVTVAGPLWHRVRTAQVCGCLPLPNSLLSLSTPDSMNI